MFRTKSCLYQVYPGHIDKDPPRSGGQRRHSCKNLEALQGQDEQQCEKGGQANRNRFQVLFCSLRTATQVRLNVEVFNLRTNERLGHGCSQPICDSSSKVIDEVFSCANGKCRLYKCYYRRSTELWTSTQHFPCDAVPRAVAR